ncbi:MAG: hypothetical protein JW810_04930, partial [Sedimentisphaerales bacterium]|nr:hypothetical protein [Sedimentisphaerales bacterium]
EKPEIQMPGDLDDTERQWIRVDRVSYDDESPWPTAPDGSDDYVLRRLIATHYGNDVANWVAATPSPGQ